MTTLALRRGTLDDMRVGSRGDRFQWHASHKARVRGPQGVVQFRFVFSEAEAEAQTKLKEHFAYLARMAAEGVVPLALARRAKVVWLLASATAGDGLPIPAAVAFTGGPIEYHWEGGAHQISVEIPSEGPCHWFYRNRTTGEIWGADVPPQAELPAQLAHYLGRLVASNR